MEEVVAKRLSFGETQAMLSAGDDGLPTVTAIRRALTDLGQCSARFAALRDAAADQAFGNTPADLERLKQQFSKLKFNLTEVETKRRFMAAVLAGELPALGDEPAAPDQAAEDAAAKKAKKAENASLRAEVARLAAVTSSELSALETARSALAAEFAGLESLLESQPPGLESLIASANAEAAAARAAEAESLTAAAADAATAAGLESRVATAEARVAALRASLGAAVGEVGTMRAHAESLEAAAGGVRAAADRRVSLAEAGAWTAEMRALVGALSGVTLVGVETDCLRLRLATHPRPGGTGPVLSHALAIFLEPGSTALRDLQARYLLVILLVMCALWPQLAPDDVAVGDIVAAARGTRKLSFAVREVMARIADRAAEAGGSQGSQ